MLPLWPLWVALAVLLLSFGWWCWLYIGGGDKETAAAMAELVREFEGRVLLSDGEQPIRELDGIEEM